MASAYMDIDFVLSTPLNNSQDSMLPKDLPLHHSFLIKDNRKHPDNFFLAFLKEVIMVGEFSKEVAILAFIYSKRFFSSTGIRGKINYQRVIGTAFFLAQKIQNDLALWYIPEFSQITRISELNLKNLERDFSKCIDYRFYVSEKEFESTLTSLNLSAM